MTDACDLNTINGTLIYKILFVFFFQTILTYLIMNVGYRSSTISSRICCHIAVSSTLKRYFHLVDFSTFFPIEYLVSICIEIICYDDNIKLWLHYLPYQFERIPDTKESQVETCSELKKENIVCKR